MVTRDVAHRTLLRRQATPGRCSAGTSIPVWHACRPLLSRVPRSVSDWRAAGGVARQCQRHPPARLVRRWWPRCESRSAHPRTLVGRARRARVRAVVAPGLGWLVRNGVESQRRSGGNRVVLPRGWRVWILAIARAQHPGGRRRWPFGRGASNTNRHGGGQKEELSAETRVCSR